MKIKENISPWIDELPSNYADRIGILYSSVRSADFRRENGQFFTPPAISKFMSSLSELKGREVKILDPGCGVGILSLTLVENLIQKNKKLKKVEIIAYETDSKLIPYAQESFSYLKKWAKKQGIVVDYLIRTNDFILDNKSIFNNKFEKLDKYDVVISNPPYFKLSNADMRARIANKVVHGQANIYSLFLFTAANLLKENGELIFIVPRSFTSGYYFKSFRDKFFALITLKKVHVFESRKLVFERDDILQESIILVGVKSSSNLSDIVELSTSNGSFDVSHFHKKCYRYNDILDFRSEHKILHLPVNDEEAFAVKIFKGWNNNLASCGIKISTGPVVSFRAKQLLFPYKVIGDTTVPLIYLHNVQKMILKWPLENGKKPQYIKFSKESFPLLIKNGNYIFLRRFSSKDDKSRLIACPHFRDSLEFDYIGVENHLNYIYKATGDFKKPELLGLCALLNSSLFDNYFRSFNGNINVSATELREMPLPSVELINEIGNIILVKKEITQDIIDDTVEEILSLKSSSKEVYA